MRPAILVSAATLALSACATSPSASLVEQGYERGTLGVAAIARHDWATAEKGLMRTAAVRADDPARLINLGRVYMETGRREEARAAWQLALASPRHFVVETGSGEVVSTDALARRLLARY
ncbi:hypothetical protein SH591_03850 [Sphingomonas sp. LY54]|uniref:hypothetical protein n=1 Tax=Sphingomonas sp. LY54 TaxID=3095343 RepID=UPI002D77D4D2|nr:hypothetical protein [Sphingomonas sp. LY54]WRP29327.1 hypothetical protein SH591_03850 [Sphingomonas sp. LY54]